MKRALFIVMAACHSSTTTTATSTPSSTAALASPPPIEAHFADLPLHVVAKECDVQIIAVVSGSAKAGTDTLAIGDTLFTQTGPDYDVTGSGTVVHATVPLVCDGIPSRTRVLMRATDAPELTWANGAMHAHLDGDKLPYVYAGRLEGTAPVAEHVHESSWEVLCAIEASGTFTLAGVAKRLGARTCVSVPPQAKHSWSPDPGTKLVGIQFYDPPGPQNRFKVLAGQ